MSIKNLPAAPGGRPRASAKSFIAPVVFDRWDAGIQAATSDDRTITVMDVIGQDWWTGEGVTAKRVAAALRHMGAGPVTVVINSPGGDVFEGFAIYNLLRDHQGEVTVKVVGLAASSASIIAMAGDTIQIARAGFFMVHNCWTIAVGNRHELRDLATDMEPIDAAIADIYMSQTGMDLKDVQKQMDAETWVNGSSAIEQGYAHELLEADQTSKTEAKSPAAAVRRIEAALRASGLPRSEAQRVIHEFKSSLSDSAGSDERDAIERSQRDAAASEQCLNILSQFKI